MSQDLHIIVRGHGYPILMIHGIISDSTFFDSSASFLSEKYQVITYDRCGYGKSDKKEYTDYSVCSQAKDAAMILKEYCREPAWIVGNSAGGLIAIELALCYPELVKGMILVEPSLGYVKEEKEKLLVWNRELNECVNIGKIKAALPAFTKVIGGTSKKNQVVSLNELKQVYHNLSVFMFGELNEVQSYLPPIERLRQISIPVIVAVTEEGKNSIFATSSKKSAERIGWPVEWLPGYHNVAKELPEQFSLHVDRIICKYINN